MPLPLPEAYFRGMSQRFSLNFTAEGAGLRFFTGRFFPFMLAAAARKHTQAQNQYQQKGNASSHRRIPPFSFGHRPICLESSYHNSPHAATIFPSRKTFLRGKGNRRSGGCGRLEKPPLRWVRKLAIIRQWLSLWESWQKSLIFV